RRRARVPSAARRRTWPSAPGPDRRASVARTERRAAACRFACTGLPFAATMSDLIAPDETAFRLELTAAQLKIVHTALKSLFDDLGHEEHDVKRVVHAVLAKLPGEHEIRAIDLDRELRGPTTAAS